MTYKENISVYKQYTRKEYEKYLFRVFDNVRKDLVSEFLWIGDKKRQEVLRSENTNNISTKYRDLILEGCESGMGK